MDVSVVFQTRLPLPGPLLFLPPRVPRLATSPIPSAKMSSPAYDMGIDTSRRNAKPRALTDNERARLEEFLEAIHYSNRYVA